MGSLAGGIPINAKTQLKVSRVSIWNWVLFSQGRAPGTPSAAPAALSEPMGLIRARGFGRWPPSPVAAHDRWGGGEPPRRGI
jgi:hypothetical protein